MLWQTSSTMHTAINLKDSKRQAFVRGFWKGLAAPFLLYSVSSIPDEAIVKLQPLPDRDKQAKSDWVRVGDELRKAAAEDRATRRG
jgi:hypothetical protein